jgi:hypothetical protein
VPRAVVVLVVAMPCPLILAAPVALVSGLSAAARRGIVVKNGGVLERLARCTTVLLDKNGTLTADHRMRQTMSKRTRAAAFGAATTALAAGLGAYLVFFRRQCLTWGARPDEVSRRLPGDELLPGAGIVATRAITIDAPPAAIWPWLVQMGSGRGGVYTYDWIENLFGLDMHSARRILPQYQGVKVGDEFPLGPGRPAMRVAVLDPERTFTLRFADGNWVWIFALSAEDGHTRLISRNRIAAAGAWPARLFGMLVMEPGSLIMERRMLLGIKERAEDLARQQPA